MSAQVAIVAGGGGELGRATAMALAAGGRSVVAVDRSERGLLDLPSGIRREVADTTDPAGQLIDRIAAEVGPPAVLVNTVGAFGPEDTLRTTAESCVRRRQDRAVAEPGGARHAAVLRVIVHVAARQDSSQPAAWRPGRSCRRMALREADMARESL